MRYVEKSRKSWGALAIGVIAVSFWAPEAFSGLTVEMGVADTGDNPRSVFCVGETVRLMATSACDGEPVVNPVFVWTWDGDSATTAPSSFYDIKKHLDPKVYNCSVTVTDGKESGRASSAFTVVELASISGLSAVCVSQGGTFTAASNPSGAGFPEGCPKWEYKKKGGQGGGSPWRYAGSGQSIRIIFPEPGQYRLKAECGNKKKEMDVAVLKVELTGSASTTRGNNETYTATVTPDGLNPTFNWKFTGGDTTVQKSTGTTKTWGGVMVASGTIEVTVTVGSTEFKATLDVAVNARNWNADVQAPNVNRAWGDPPTYAGDLGEVQATGIQAGTINVIAAKIADEGPNNGFTYVTAQPVQHGMIIRINQYLNNSGSAFSLAQGNAGDVQVIPLEQGLANSTIITAGTNGEINTTPSGDDAIVGTVITSGPDGIADTVKNGDDVQIIAIGFGQPNSIIINSGSSGRLNIAADPSSDDATVGTYITSGADGVANTEIDNRSEVSQAILLSAVEKHEGTSGNQNETSHWTYWYQIEAADIDMNEEAEDEVGAGTANELKTAVSNKLEPIRIRLSNAWTASPEPPSYLTGGTTIDFRYPDPSWPAY